MQKSFKNFAGLIILVLVGTLVFANTYPVKSIPEDLKKNAHVVIRKDVRAFEIVNQTKAVYKVHRVVTIFNQNGKNFGYSVVPYDQFSKIKKFTGEVFDANGNSIKKLKKKDIIDVSNVSGFSIYEDNRIQIGDLTQLRYPYTVEFEFEIEFKSLFIIPDLNLIPDFNIGVEKASYTISFPEELSPRYHTVNVNSEPEIRDDGIYKTITWEFKNIQALKKEAMSAPTLRNTPRILNAPSQFEYDGHAGSMESWKDFGLWIKSLNENRQDLSASTIAKIRELTALANDDKEKVEILYNYLQNKTRYVSIQLGIGGFQPFKASLVDEKGYGDCKALSNYMAAMLKAIDIPSVYVLVKAGPGAPDVIPEFPGNQFNHAILAVPVKSDTLWLECTSQTNPFGYLGSFTSDRWVLLITDDGGKLVRTPKYSEEKNKQITIAKVELDEVGNALASVSISYEGMQYENGGLYGVLHKGNEDQKKWLQNNIDISSFDILNFEFVNFPAPIPKAKIELELGLRRFANTSGKRLFLQPNLMNKASTNLNHESDRLSSFKFSMPYIDVDSIEYTFKENFYPEFVPEDISIESEFGTYNSKFIFDSGKLIYIREFRKESGEFPPEKYNDYVDFTREVNKADNTRIILINTT